MQNSVDNLMTQAAFSRHIGKTRGYVTQLKTHGRLVMTADGKRVMVAESMQLIADTEDPNRVDVKERHAQARTQGVGTADTLDAPDYDENTPKLGKAKAKEAHYKALQAEIAYKKEVGELVDKQEMQAAVSDCVLVFKQGIENLPHLVAPELVGKDVNAVRGTLKQYVFDALQDMERNFKQKITEAGDAAG